MLDKASVSQGQSKSQAKPNRRLATMGGQRFDRGSLSHFASGIHPGFQHVPTQSTESIAGVRGNGSWIEGGFDTPGTTLHSVKVKGTVQPLPEDPVFDIVEFAEAFPGPV